MTRTPAVALALFVAFTRDAHAQDTHAEKGPPVDIGGFVDIEWRVMGLAEHVSHGPAFAGGVTFFDGLLRVGIGGMSRPGPMNPATFDVRLPEGTIHRDQSTLSLRSDGAFVGLHVAFATEVPGVPWLSFALPTTVGYGGFGFYLTGSDRETAPGERVSEVEDRLFQGRDSFLGVVIEGGLRIAFVVPDTPWIRPYIATHYTAVPGYTSVVRDGYRGFSGALGVELGHGL